MYSHDIHLVKLTAADIDQLKDISITTFYESFIDANTEENMQQYISKFFSREKLLEELSDTGSAFYFARLDEKPIGYLKLNTGHAQTEMKNENGLEIERIYILKELRGKNIGQLLFDKALQLAIEQKRDYLWLGVWEKNTGAIRFYERNGLVKFSEHAFMLGDDLQTDHLMKLVLKPASATGN